MSKSNIDYEINDQGVEDSHERLMESTATHLDVIDIEKTPQSDKQAEPGLSAQAGDDLSHLKKIRNPNQLRDTPNETTMPPTSFGSEPATGRTGTSLGHSSFA